ncbi:MAG: SCO family protein [Granulosicoccus sp.]
MSTTLIPKSSTPKSSTQRHRQHGKALPIVAVAVLALVAGIFASGQFDSFYGADKAAATEDDKADQASQLAALQDTLQTSLALPMDFKRVPEFELLDANSEAVTQTLFDDKWSMVFFGYTHCPDVCPITLQVMKNVLEKLSNDGEQTLPQVVFVSVDPVRDTSEVMKNYISFFNESFVGVTGDVKKVHDMTRKLGIVASFIANESDPDNYIVDHTASLLLIDPQRRLRAKITPPHEVDTIVADYLNLIAAPS